MKQNHFLGTKTEQIQNFGDQNRTKNSLRTKLKLAPYFKDQNEVLTLYFSNLIVRSLVKTLLCLMLSSLKN